MYSIYDVDAPGCNHGYFKQHKINDIPTNFLRGELAHHTIITCSERVENAQSLQNGIDKVSDEVWKVYIMEEWIIGS